MRGFPTDILSHVPGLGEDNFFYQSPSPRCLCDIGYLVFARDGLVGGWVGIGSS